MIIQVILFDWIMGAKLSVYTLFKTWHVVKITSPQKYKGAPDSINMAFVNSIRVLFFLSATPLEAREYGTIV